MSPAAAAYEGRSSFPTSRASARRFDLRLQRSQLRYVTTSRAQATALAENYVGLAEV